MPHFGIRCRRHQTLYDEKHIGITFIGSLVNIKNFLVLMVLPTLVEDTQHFVQTVVYLSMKPGNLHYDAIMCEAVDKWIRQTFGHKLVIVIIRMPFDV